MSVGTISVLVEIVSCNSVIYSANAAADHTIQFLDTPVVTRIAPRFVPRLIEYPPNQKILDEHKLTIFGSGFDSSIEYSCRFEYGFSAFKEVVAEYIDSNSIR
mmetsp:Transcript_6134/g.7087  ORF Transcript_6134/g.7087 Transcript_6134/m.7087 type:complete len:103 (-) Transcript_6134:5-313(-)